VETPQTSENTLDQILVLRSRLGDSEAFAELVGRYHDRLRYFVRRLLGNADAAEDAVQDAWLSAYRQIHRLRQDELFRVWLFRIARNTAITRVRRRAAARLVPLDEAAAVAEADDAEPAFTPEEAAEVHRCLARLEPEHREVLVLRFLEAMSYEQIAAVMGEKLGTVKSRIHYAKHAMRRELEGAR
jgi:RNA polymerase sigma-70 factor (ECF subfamily)